MSNEVMSLSYACSFPKKPTNSVISMNVKENPILPIVKSIPTCQQKSSLQTHSTASSAGVSKRE